MPPEKQRVAIIGAGGIANGHAAGYKANAALCELVAVCDINEEAVRKFAEKHGVPKTYTDPAQLLTEARPEAVSVCTPNYLHAPLSIAALDAGVNVLCEKPMATTLADAEAMKAASERAGRTLYIGFNHRFIGKFQQAKALLDGGEYGKLLAARIAIGHGGYERLSHTWFAQRALSGGGTFIDNGVHMLDLLRWYGGGITEVSAQAHRLLMAQGDVEDNAIGVFRLADGGIASLQCSWTWPPGYTLLFHMILENGTIDLSGNDVVAYKTGDKESTRLTPPEVDTWAEQVKAFLTAAQTGKPGFVTPADGLAAVKVALAAYESSDTGRTVRLK